MNERKVWVIVRSNGETYTLLKEPLEGIVNWARGQDVTVHEYAFSRIVYKYTPPPDPTAKGSP